MDASDQELQQYPSDLHGYLVIHDVLGATEVAELNPSVPRCLGSAIRAWGAGASIWCRVVHQGVTYAHG